MKNKKSIEDYYYLFIFIICNMMLFNNVNNKNISALTKSLSIFI